MTSLYNIELYNCRLCHKPANNFCENCGDPYCSPICQINDWQRHRYICMPMPNLIEGNYLAQQTLEVQTQQIQNESILEYPEMNSCVLLTAICGLNVAYVCLASLQKQFNQILDKVHKYGKTAPLLSTAPRTNSYAITSNMNTFMRVKILKTNGGVCGVQFMDTGYKTNRKIKELHEIPEEYINLPTYVLPVNLNSLPREYIKSQVSGLGLEKLINKRYCISYVKSEDNSKFPVVELINIDNSETVNEKILHLLKKMQTMNISLQENGNMSNQASFNENSILKSSSVENINKAHDLKETSSIVKKSSSSTTNANYTNGTGDILKTPSVESLAASNRSLKLEMALNIKIEHKPVMEPPFKFISMKEVQKNLKLFVLDTTDLNSGIFGAIREKDMPHLQEIKNYIDNVYKPGPTPYAPMKDEYCMAKFEDEWYRARCHNVQNGKYFVYYIDFTNEDTLTKECIRPYDMKLTKDCLAMSCTIRDFPDLGEDDVDFVRKWGIENFSAIQVDSAMQECDGGEGPCFIWVEIKDLITKMRNAKLIK